MKDFGRFLFIVFLVPSFLFASHQQDILKTSDIVIQAREFVSLLDKSEFAKAVKDFDRAMSEAMQPEQLQEVWESITAHVGALKKQIDAQIQSSPEFNFVFITCQFEKASLDIKIAFNNEGKISGLWFIPAHSAAPYKPPAYVNPSSFKEKEVKVGRGDYILPGTLTMPKEGFPSPAVVLVHGSGPQDRDESIGPNKPFRDLAWGLASKNIAVLRYEKRTYIYAKKISLRKEMVTVKEETIDDALSAAKMLQETDGVDASKIFVLGHSLGGMLIPRLADLDQKIAGFIILAGTSRPLEDIILEQMHYIYSVDGKISEDERKKLDEVKEAVYKIKNLKPSDIETTSENILGAPAAYWLDLRGYNPAHEARKIKRPMLILQGGRDYQVTKEDFQNWKEALASREEVKFKFYPQLNHLFIPGKGKIMPTEYNKAGHVAEEVIEDIASWIKTISRRQAQQTSFVL